MSSYVVSFFVSVFVSSTCRQIFAQSSSVYSERLIYERTNPLADLLDYQYQTGTIIKSQIYFIKIVVSIEEHE
jgi:hypothetical protein